jgi:putative dimethyl sulfoxide reductase chaperone
VTDFELREQVRSAGYYHLARLFELPDAFLVEERVLDKLHVALAAVNDEAAEHAAHLARSFGDEGLERVRRDHIKLFVGPEGLLAPPYGSIYLDPQHEIMGPSTLDAARLYGAAGLQKAPSLKEPPDHIRVELDFMHRAIERTLEAVRAEAWDEAGGLIDVQIAFLQNHLARWVTPFAKVLRTGAGTGFYRHAAGALEAFVRQEYVEDAAAMLAEFRALRGAAGEG